MGKKGLSKYFNVFNVGQKFGKYTVIDNDISINKEAQILCQCECGVTNFISCYTLINGKSKGCLKCNNPRERDKNPTWKGFENISGKYYGRIKRGAENRKIPFEVTIEYFNDLLVNQNFKCNLTGLDISFSHSKTNNYEATASIDRIDSNYGYVKGNLQWIHKDVNLMKNHFNQDYFLKICEKITNERKEREKTRT
jgi:hypothetical protein